MQSKMGLPEIIRQLESCGYTCEAGPLEKNEAFVALTSISESDCDSCISDEESRQKELCKECRVGPPPGRWPRGAQALNVFRLGELLQITNAFFQELLKHRSGNNPLKPAEIMFVADVIHDTINRWYQGSGR
ncbi:MAG: hypothetical protein MJA84_04605 [Firmicutes bacterium]|nr:hypothetical protein [Bacillota bacterium]